MAYYGVPVGCGNGWHGFAAGRGVGGGGERFPPYARCAGAVPGAGLGVGEPVPVMSQGGDWMVGEQLPAVGAKRVRPLAMVRPEAMRAAEAAAGEVVLRLHPTEEAEKRRQGVIDYAKRLIGTSFGCEVFAFGSVPLKTYLPDGDVDITVLTNAPLDSTFIDDVCHVLETEEQNTDAQFALKRMKFINAEVKLIKCVIDNIVVDISFNQIGGLSTLCFLELVDSEVGKNHLFKRSIILIKAWCYHECHILGAHHWLISTYALEILILHIFNLFHKSLHGPLEALYKFLEYYSKFEWDKYGLTLNGPVPLSSLRNFTVEPTAVNDELLLGKESLMGSLDRLLVLPRVSDRRDAKFRLKHLNIIDPLKGSNNLGRSVSRGSFFRVQNAFSFGAQKLGEILMLPSELIPDEIYGLFANTLKRHGRGERQDLGNRVLFQSLLDPENAHREHVSGLNSYMNEDENRSPDNSLELPDKESNVETNMHKTSDRYLPADAKDRTWNKIWLSSADYYNMVPGASVGAKSSYLTNFRSHSSFSPENGNTSVKRCRGDGATEEDLRLSRSAMQQQHILTSSTRTNTLDVSSSCPVNESKSTDVHQEKLLLPPFSPSNLLDLSGDLGLHLGCLRNVQYNLEALFDKFLESVQEASLAGVLDESSFKIPTLSFLSNTDARPPRLSLASSTDKDRRNASPVYCSHSTRDVPQHSHTEVQVDAVRQQNVSLSSGAHILSDGWSLSPPPLANSQSYHVSWFYTTEDIPETHGAGVYMPDMNVSLPSGTDTLSIGLTLSSSPTIDPENCYVSWPYMTGDIPKTRGTGTYIPKMTYEIYRDRMSSDKGRRQRQKQPDRVYSSNEHIAVESATSQTVMKQNNSQLNALSSKSLDPKAGSVSFKERASIDCETKQIPTSQTWKVQNSEQRYVCSDMNMIDNQYSDANEGLVRPENGSRETPIFRPPKLALPHHGGNGQGNLLVSRTGQSSPAATKSNTQTKGQQEEDIEFGSVGPFSTSLLTAKFCEDFPPLPTSKRPVNSPVSTVQSPRPGVIQSSKKPVDTPASTVQSPRPGASATQNRPEGLYQLKDDADFPPLQGGAS